MSNDKQKYDLNGLHNIFPKLRYTKHSLKYRIVIHQGYTAEKIINKNELAV